MSYKSRLWLCGSALGLSLGLLCVAGLFRMQTAHPVSAVIPLATVTSSPQQPLYIVRSYQDQVCVFHVGEIIPELFTGIPVSTLPEADRISLQTGIQLNSKEDLASLLEDYGY